MAHGLGCFKAYGIFLDQGSNLCLLHWQADSLPLSHQGNPELILNYWLSIYSNFSKDVLSNLLFSFDLVVLLRCLVILTCELILPT